MIGAGPRAKHFYPRSPCGERRILTILTCTVSIFLSTLSLRRATSVIRALNGIERFLSTLSLRRATLSASGWMSTG